jgi:hypothetical protein
MNVDDSRFLELQGDADFIPAPAISRDPPEPGFVGTYLGERVYHVRRTPEAMITRSSAA